MTQRHPTERRKKGTFDEALWVSKKLCPSRDGHSSSTSPSSSVNFPASSSTPSTLFLRHFNSGIEFTMDSDAPENVEKQIVPENGPSDAVPEPIAPGQDLSKLPTRSDVSLREFLSKIDDFAPIVRLRPIAFTFDGLSMLTKFLFAADSRRSDSLLHDQSRPASSSSNRSPTRPSPGARHAEIHRRRRGRRVSVQPHPRVQQHQQSHGHPRCGSGISYSGTAVRPAGKQGARQRRSIGNPAAGLWRRWTGRKPEQDGVDDGGLGNGGWRVRC